MQKNSTSLKKTDLLPEKKRLKNAAELQPSSGSLQKVLQFASSYRAEKVAGNQYVEWYLN